MSSIWGKNIKISLFGESHGEAIGIVLDGFPPGIRLDMDEIRSEMNRRKPGTNAFSTPRQEKDEFEIISGYFEDHTTGTPLCIMIRNKDKRSKDYSVLKDTLRPGHADYTGRLRYKGYNDYRGSGHFSGRITAPLVFAGAVAYQIIKELGVVIGTHIYSVSNVYDEKISNTVPDRIMLDSFRKEVFPLVDGSLRERMQNEILKAKEDGDSVGGIIETVIINLPAGLGSPFFESVETKLSQMLFSIPAVKGLEFGDGFELAGLRGSMANDAFIMEDGVIKTRTNHNGGINGGITNGMPVTFRTAIKPTSSISMKQDTVNAKNMEKTVLEVAGRHDPCIVPRVIPVIDAAAALVALDLLLDGGHELIWK